MKLKLHPRTLHLKQVFTTSHGSVQKRESIIIELIQDGISGFGEAVAISYYHKNVSGFIELLNKVRPIIESLELQPPDQMFNQISAIVEDHFIIAAFDNALYDLYAKIHNQTVRQYLQIPEDSSILSTYTIGINTPAKSAQYVKENPWPIYKIKLGTPLDKQVIEQVNKITDSPLVVDANSGWSVEKTIEMSQWLKTRNVQFIEQPISADRKDLIQQIHGKCMLPLIADESCHTIEDLAFCLENFDGINIKLMKCGGITPALKMIEAAKANNKMVMVGCMTESSIGISAAAQLLPLIDFADLDGAILISNDPANGVKLVNGKITFPNRFGHGGILNN